MRRALYIPTFQCDRLAWARAVREEKLYWGFQGLSRPNTRDDRRKYYKQHSTTSWLAETMLQDERYMDALMYQETKYLVENDGDDEFNFAHYVRRQLHGDGCCPHGSAEEKARFAAACAKMEQDADAKWRWAADQVDWSWVADSVRDGASDVDSIAWHLKEHPVDAVWSPATEEWVDLSEVKGYCPECDTPVQDQDIHDSSEKLEPRVAPHFYREDCELCAAHPDLGNDMQCLFDPSGVRRRIFVCPNCAHTDALDSLEGRFVIRHGRPFDWPPGAPFPPRRDFVGAALNPSPWED